MSQIWLTYDELASLLTCNQKVARDIALKRGLSRRRCRDGQTRAKLDAILSEQFLEDVGRRWMESQVATYPSALRVMHGAMAFEREATARGDVFGPGELKARIPRAGL